MRAEDFDKKVKTIEKSFTLQIQKLENMLQAQKTHYEHEFGKLASKLSNDEVDSVKVSKNVSPECKAAKKRKAQQTQVPMRIRINKDIDEDCIIDCTTDVKKAKSDEDAVKKNALKFLRENNMKYVTFAKELKLDRILLIDWLNGKQIDTQNNEEIFIIIRNYLNSMIEFKDGNEIMKELKSKVKVHSLMHSIKTIAEDMLQIPKIKLEYLISCQRSWKHVDKETIKILEKVRLWLKNCKSNCSIIRRGRPLKNIYLPGIKKISRKLLCDLNAELKRQRINVCSFCKFILNCSCSNLNTLIRYGYVSDAQKTSQLTNAITRWLNDTDRALNYKKAKKTAEEIGLDYIDFIYL